MKTIGRALIVATAMLASTGQVSAQELRGNGLIADAQWVAGQVGRSGVVVLQIGPPDVYQAEHLAGARAVDLQRLASNGDLVLELPAPDALRSSLGALGISDDSQVIIVHAGGWVTPATRLAFTLDYAGLGDRTVILDGGLEAWKEAGLPVTSDVPPPVNVALSRPVADRVVTQEWVGMHSGDAGVSLIDARAQAFFDGARDDQGSVGHIENAVSLPMPEIFNEVEGIVWFKSDDDLRSLFAERGVQSNDLVVAYCHIGQHATAILLGARATGHETRLFDGSMDQWRKLGLPLISRIP